MAKIVTSIRLDEGLLRRAMALGLNVSRVTEDALNAAVQDLEPKATGVIRFDAVGLGSSSQILMMNDGKFKPIEKVRVRDPIVSYNEVTGRCQEARVIDVGPLTEEETSSLYLEIVDNIGTRVELLPNSKIFCSPSFGSDAQWVLAQEVREGSRIANMSGYYRHSGPIGSTVIKRVRKIRAREVAFKLEAYPNNSFFANSNRIRKLHLIADGLPAAWGIPVKGYPGQIGRLLERQSHTVVHA